MPLRTLAIDTATPWLSVALFDGETLVGHVHREVGRGHAEMLLPTIASLPDGGKADRILVGCGPGSFTGVRIGIAAARALAFGWNASIAGFDTLTLVAANARARHPALATATFDVVVDGGHGEWLLGGAPGQARALSPDVAIAHAADHVAGIRAAELVERRATGCAFAAEADARSAIMLSNQDLFAHVVPAYARDPDAKVAAS